MNYFGISTDNYFSISTDTKVESVKIPKDFTLAKR